MSDFSFETFVKDVAYIHNATSGMANRAVNQLLTLRNWIIGYYIVEFEQHGRNRAEYGSNLLEKLADKVHIKGLDRTMLNLCRLFYVKYPQIRDAVNHRLMIAGEIKSLPDYEMRKFPETPDSFQICDSVNHKFETEAETLIRNLSFTHIREILVMTSGGTNRFILLPFEETAKATCYAASGMFAKIDHVEHFHQRLPNIS